MRFLRVPRELSRGELDKLEELARRFGAKRARLPRLRRRRAEPRSPIAKFLGPAELERFASPAGPHACSSRADEPAMVSRVLGALRLHLGRELELIDAERLALPLGDRLPDVRVGRRARALGRRAPPLHASDRRGRGAARQRPRQPRRRSPTTSSGTGSSSPAARSGSTSPSCRRRCSTCCAISAGRAAREVRLPARRARDGRAAARRDRLGHRPARDGAARRAVHPRHASPSRRTRPGSTRCRARRPRSSRRSCDELGIAVTRQGRVSGRGAAVPTASTGSGSWLEVAFLGGLAALAAVARMRAGGGRRGDGLRLGRRRARSSGRRGSTGRTSGAGCRRATTSRRCRCRRPSR